jgi:hypothetical protein
VDSASLQAPSSVADARATFSHKWDHCLSGQPSHARRFQRHSWIGQAGATPRGGLPSDRHDRVHVAEIEVRRSDAQEHRHRVETRIADVAGLILPSWQEIDALTPDPWLRDHIVIDTAGRSPEDCLVELMARLPCAYEQRAGKGS